MQGIAVNNFAIDHPRQDAGIIVKKTSFAGAKEFKRKGRTVYLSVTVPGVGRGVTWPPDGLLAQGNRTPGKMGEHNWLGKCFSDHDLTYRDSNEDNKRQASELIYDPSYGQGPFGKLVQWRVAAIAGYTTREAYAQNGKNLADLLAKPINTPLPGALEPPLEIAPPPLVEFALP